MTKKEAIQLIKSNFHNAVSCSDLKSLKDLYGKVKDLDIKDDAALPEDLEREISDI